MIFFLGTKSVWPPNNNILPLHKQEEVNIVDSDTTLVALQPIAVPHCNKLT